MCAVRACSLVMRNTVAVAAHVLKRKRTGLIEWGFCGVLEIKSRVS